MDMCTKPNLKRSREILLKDHYSKDENVDDYSDFKCDSDTEYELRTDVDKSDDTSIYEHISEQADINDDNDMANIPLTRLQKGELTSSSNPSSNAFKLFFTNEILDIVVLHTNEYAKQCFDQNKNKQKISKTKTKKYHEWQPIDRLSPIRVIFGLFVKQGRCITVDRYFNGIKLCEALVDRKMTLVGAVGHRLSFVPDEIKQCRKELYSS